MSLQEKKTTTTITTKLQRWGHSSPHSIDWHKKERDSERDSFYLLCMCVSVWVCCVCVCVCLSLSVFQTLSLSLSPSVFLLPGALSPCLSFVRTCAQQTMSSAAAQQQHQRCLTAMRISGPQTQLLNTSFHQDLSLSLSLSLFSCPLFRASSFGTSFYGPHYFSTSLQDSFSSGPRF
jgi:hypothetical protein